MGGGGGVGSASIQSASAQLPSSITMTRDVRFWHKADIGSGHSECPLLTHSGHSAKSL